MFEDEGPCLACGLQVCELCPDSGRCVERCGCEVCRELQAQVWADDEEDGWWAEQW